ncbi:MAG: peptidylprolyl isomerase [Thermodesulfobacteriota bacterium]
MKQQNTGKNSSPNGFHKILVIVLFYAIALGLIIGIPYYQKMVAPWRHPLVRVGNLAVTSRDLVQRLRFQPDESGLNRLEGITALLQEMEKELLIRQEATEQKIQITEQELDQEIQNRVKALSPGEGKFDELYGALLRKMRLKEKEYRSWVEKDLFRVKLLQALYNKMQDEAEQIHLSIIVVGSSDKAEAIRERLKRGEDFSRMARETSVDLETAQKGGEFGWIPKEVDTLLTSGQIRVAGVLTKTQPDAEKIRSLVLAGQDMGRLARDYSLDKVSVSKGGSLGWISAEGQEGKFFGPELFALNPGEVSRPIQVQGGFWILKVSEKTPAGKVIDEIAFQLSPGTVSPPINTDRGFYLLKVLGRETRPLSKEQKAQLTEKVLAQRLEAKAAKGRREGRIKWDWGSETYDWVVRQLK